MEIVSATIGLAGVIIGSMIAIVGQWLTEKKKHSRELAYAAVLLAYTAKILKRDILNIVQNFDEFQHVNDEQRHYPHISLILALDELDVNWKVVPIRSLDRIFECRARLKSNEDIYDTPMAANMDCVQCDAIKLLDLIEIGDMLVDAASGLRAEARIPKDQALVRLSEEAAFYVEQLRRYAK
jgi:hypothetical protein